MDNDYYYDRPDEREDETVNEYEPYHYGESPDPFQNPDPQDIPPAPPAKEKKPGFFRRVVAFVAAAALFGAVGGTAFQAASFLTGRVLGVENSATLPEHTENVQIGNTNLNTSTSTITSDVSGIVKETIPSIVSITNMSIQQVQSFFGQISERESVSCGSGIIIADNQTELLIVTNNHVVEGNTSLTVQFCDDTVVNALVKGTDSSRDLAIVAVTLSDIPSETMQMIKIATLGDSDNLNVGEPAIAIGNALGYGQSVTAGIISATKRTIEDFEGEYIQTDAAINPGNSGGALLNANGEVIGINSAKISASKVEGMGFAIPITDASDIIKSLMNRQTRTKVPEKEQGYLGIEGYTVEESAAKMYNMPVGVYIAKAVEGEGVAKAGISKGTIITAFDGMRISGMDDLKGQLEYYKAGEKVTITISVPSSSGDYEESDVEVTLGRRPAQ